MCSAASATWIGASDQTVTVCNTVLQALPAAATAAKRTKTALGLAEQAVRVRTIQTKGKAILWLSKVTSREVPAG